LGFFIFIFCGHNFCGYLY